MIRKVATAAPRDRRWRPRILIAFVVLVIAALIGFVGGGWKATDDIFVHAPRTAAVETPAAKGLGFERLALVSGDGTQLDAWWIPAQHCGDPCTARATVVAAAGYTGNKSGTLAVSDALTRRGFNVLAVDLRGQGESGGHTTLSAHEPEDMLAAAATAREKGGVELKIGLYGHSMGAATALLAAERANGADPGAYPRISAVVEDSGFASMGEMLRQEIPRQSGLPQEPTVTFAFTMTRLRLGFNPDSIRPADAASTLGCPLLVIHGSDDPVVPVENAVRIYDRAREPKSIWIVPGAEHDSGVGAAPGEFSERLGEFYGRYLS